MFTAIPLSHSPKGLNRNSQYRFSKSHDLTAPSCFGRKSLNRRVNRGTSTAIHEDPQMVAVIFLFGFLFLALYVFNDDIEDDR